MSFTGVDSLDHSIHTSNTWLADIADGFPTEDRRLAYRVLRAWLHTLRDRLTVEIAAHFAAQLPELLRGVFFDGWDPGRVPIKYGREEYIRRFAQTARISDADVPKAAAVVTGALRHHLSAGLVDQVLAQVPRAVRTLLEPPRTAAGGRA